MHVCSVCGDRKWTSVKTCTEPALIVVCDYCGVQHTKRPYPRATVDYRHSRVFEVAGPYYCDECLSVDVRMINPSSAGSLVSRAARRERAPPPPPPKPSTCRHPVWVRHGHTESIVRLSVTAWLIDDKNVNSASRSVQPVDASQCVASGTGRTQVGSSYRRNVVTTRLLAACVDTYNVNERPAGRYVYSIVLNMFGGRLMTVWARCIYASCVIYLCLSPITIHRCKRLLGGTAIATSDRWILIIHLWLGKFRCGENIQHCDYRNATGSCSEVGWWGGRISLVVRRLCVEHSSR